MHLPLIKWAIANYQQLLFKFSRFWPVVLPLFLTHAQLSAIEQNLPPFNHHIPCCCVEATNTTWQFPSHLMSKKKASSSSAAAAVAGFGFSGFGSVESVQALVQGLPLLPWLLVNNSTFLQNISPEFQMIFKKLTKKDATTKRKGLKELSDLFETLAEANEGPVISRWAQEFPKLLEDTDVRVRIHGLQVMESLAKKVGRRLAPHLKTLITPWIMAKFDSRNEVAQAAHSTLFVRVMMIYSHYSIVEDLFRVVSRRRSMWVHWYFVRLKCWITFKTVYNLIQSKV